MTYLTMQKSLSVIKIIVPTMAQEPAPKAAAPALTPQPMPPKSNGTSANKKQHQHSTKNNGSA